MIHIVLILRAIIVSNKFDINVILEKLKKRRIFTSEADLQLEMAWIIKELYSNAIVRLEYCPNFNSKIHIDILVILSGKWIPIELKYKTNKIQYTDRNGCQYILKSQNAHDYGCYDYIKDISRIESIRENEPDKFEKGYTVFITNDTLYKNGPQKNSSYVPFSLKQGRKINSNEELQWLKGKSVDKKHEKPITIKDNYIINWIKSPFSVFSDEEIEEPQKSQKTKIFYVLYNEIK